MKEIAVGLAVVGAVLVLTVALESLESWYAHRCYRNAQRGLKLR